MRIPIYSLMCCLALCSPAFAQQQSSPRLTDTELHIAYCFGYLSAQSRARQSVCGAPNEGGQFCAGATQADDQFRRVASYLMAKGILSPGTLNSAPTGNAMVVIGQGAQDWQQCFNWTASEPGMSCAASCGSPSQTVDGFNACLNACQPQICQKAETCGDSSLLPY